jgi:hypothetical protein
LPWSGPVSLRGSIRRREDAWSGWQQTNTRGSDDRHLATARRHLKSLFVNMRQLTKGRRLVVHVKGVEVPCVTVGGLAAAVGRSVRTIRRWEKLGLIPVAPLRRRSEHQCAIIRLYPTALVEAISSSAASMGFGARRPSDSFADQRRQLHEAQARAMSAILRNGVNQDHAPVPRERAGVWANPRIYGQLPQEHGPGQGSARQA